MRAAPKNGSEKRRFADTDGTTLMSEIYRYFL